MRHLICLLCVVTLALAGCGRSPRVLTGAVRVNDRTVERGHLTFFPVEGTKGTHAAEIVDGRYQTNNVPPGQWRVQITEPPDAIMLKQPDGSPLLYARPNRPIVPAAKPELLIIDVGSAKQQAVDLIFHQ